ncbi:RING/U-box superfamily protein isoform X2 [Wolffia australiana]
MRCNACWRELEGRAVSTTCGHLLCTEDAGKILNNDGACPICDQVLSKSLMKPVDINPGEEWINMAMAGVSPQILMKSAYKSVMFFTGQRELEMQYKTNKIIGQFRQKCELMQEKFSEKLEQVHSAYQKMSKRCQMMEQEMERLSKEKQELQEKIADKSRQKRKLDEMYDQLKSEHEALKRTAIQPAGHFFHRPEPDFFSSPANVMDNRHPMRQGRREDTWQPSRQKPSSSGAFDLSGGSPTKTAQGPPDGPNRPFRPVFGSGISNPSATLRNLIISPMKRPQLSRSRPQMFTL